MSSTPIPKIDFKLHSTLCGKFGPRTGTFSIKRSNNDQTSNIDISTPGLICTTTRGVIQHLSNDNVFKTTAIKWVHVPFESFLQIDPPIPTLQKGMHPLHEFLSLSPSQHIISMSLRDSANGREMPANGNSFVTAETSRGARKVTPQAYRSYGTVVLPDIIFPLTDIPFTLPPHSQKRLNKSIERSIQYLLDISRPIEIGGVVSRLNIFVPMVGGTSEAARSAFAASLLEALEPKEKEQVSVDDLDAGVSGYVFDLLPLRLSLQAELSNVPSTTIYRPAFTQSFPSLLRASLQVLPSSKPRVANTTLSPHEILILIRDIGIDLFDSFWAQQAANWGVALDFKFPAPVHSSSSTGKQQVGHNLYDLKFAHDFSRLSNQFLDGLEFSKQKGEELTDVCMCPTCTPTWNNKPLLHSLADAPNTEPIPETAPPYTRAYIHHLLHTHEMTAHALLTMHNITILDAFFRDIRKFIENEQDPAAFSREVARFEEAYDCELEILDVAKASWTAIDLVRGKGRLTRELAAANQTTNALIRST